MKSDKLRLITAGAMVVVVAAGLIAGANVGTFSGFGWDSIALLCPVGALLTMIASHTVIPRAVLSLVVMVAVVLVAGRLFCGWVCPVPLLDRLRAFFRTPAKKAELERQRHEEVGAVARAALEGCCSCTSCKDVRARLDSRHVVLGGAVLSTAVFGFPAFCLVCPIGLTFATILLVWRLFFAGDLTVAIVLAPVLLVVELTLLRKWCARICPISALMNLVARGNRTLRPVINNEVCLETAKGVPCSRCAEACTFDINLRHPEAGELGVVDCTRCRACADACPTKAISLPLRARARVGAREEAAPAPVPDLVDEEPLAD